MTKEKTPVINDQLAQFSNLLVVVSVVLYVLALLGFGADLAGVSQRRSDARLRDRELAAVGTGSGGVTTTGASETVDSAGSKKAAGQGMSARSFGFAMASVGAVMHAGAMVLRGLATDRVPWGNMYEFTMSSTAVLMILYLAFSVRRKDLRLLGTLVVLPVLIAMLVAQTWWIVPAAELTPSLQNSYWVVVHVGVAIMATALSGLGALIAVLQLLASKHEATLLAKQRQGQSDPHHWGKVGVVLNKLPDAKALEALCFRVTALGFVCWTFTLIFGAIWANDAWGRYWNWDPKEVWTFVIWVVYAVYLHARATRGFRGAKAAWFALAGFACVVINYTVVNLWVNNSLHTYSGLN